jgi:glyoxylase-like metal-dependent hydrolase (beta-lactamase superfamily II)/8-oxo-dGTP pyrophosphatase MutT (NUDIX family)
MKRIAVSVLLHPDNDSSRVLLVERNPELKFFGGYHAFPGGTLDRQDQIVPVENLPRNGGAAIGEYGSFVAAAARELFEETGVWLGKGTSTVDRSSLAHLRRRLLTGEISFLDVLEETKHVIDARDFEPLCRITTPPFVPVRYDTWFLRCRMPKSATVEILPGELMSGDFILPANTLDRWREGELLIAAPVLIMLEEMARAAGGFVERIRSLTASYDRGKLHRVFFTPGILLAPLKTPTQPPATHTNTYIVGHERLFIIDPAPYEAAEQTKLWELMDELRVEGRELAGILLTHGHPDHVGAVAECKKRYDLPIHAHADVVRSTPELEIDVFLEHGQVLELGISPDGRSDWTLRAYLTPGHAPGHLAFREDRYRALIAGDLISTLSSILIDPKDGHLRTYLQSLESIIPVAEGTAYPSHGPPAREGRKALQNQLRHRQAREKQILEALSEGPQSLPVLLEKVYRDVDKKMHGLAKRSLVSGLIKLKEQGCLRQTNDLFSLEEGWKQ